MQPNLVFVLTDDQTAETIRHMPNVRDRLIGAGRRMRNMVAQVPLCSPSRTTILRGQYAHNHRVFEVDPPNGGYARMEDLQGEMLPVWLGRAGYLSGYFGKYQNGYNTLEVPPGWARWYGHNVGENRFSDDGSAAPEREETPDLQIAKTAMDWIRERLAAPAPFYAQVGFHAPHEPFDFEERYAGRFEGERLPRDPNYNVAPDGDDPLWIRRLGELQPDALARYDDIHRRRLRSLLTVDNFVGNVLDAAREAGRLGDTHFVFYTDNGLRMADHRLRYGKRTAYEEDINFPLIWRGPGVPEGSGSDALLGNQDVAPTVCDLAGADVPAWVDGRSARPVLEGAGPWARTAIMVERRIFAGDEPDPDGPQAVPEYRALRRQNTVFVRYTKDTNEFYNFRDDPFQLDNLAHALTEEERRHLVDRLDRIAASSGAGIREAEDG